MEICENETIQTFPLYTEGVPQLGLKHQTSFLKLIDWIIIIKKKKQSKKVCDFNKWCC